MQPFEPRLCFGYVVLSHTRPEAFHDDALSCFHRENKGVFICVDFLETFQFCSHFVKLVAQKFKGL